MTRELNPDTRRKLWMITAFLAIDGIVALYASYILDPASPWAFPAIIFGMIMVVSAGSVGSMLVATRVAPKELRGSRSRQ